MCKEIFKNLLSEIDKQLLVSKKIAQERGDNFNIFRIIRMGSNETSVHSAFLADLLNPSGRHGAGDIFLRLFLNNIIPDFIFDAGTAIVKLEKDIGKISETSGGRIDLIMTDSKGKAIIIENKIYAEDQDRQMLRYYNFANDNFHGNFQLLYLSLDGDVHDETKTTGGNNIPFLAISYKDDIIPWLEFCLKEVAEKPLLREGIAHYRNLLKYLTHTDMNTETTNSLIDEVLSKKEHIANINNYKIILDKAEMKLLESFWDNLYNQIKEEKESDGRSTFEKVSVYERKHMLNKTSYDNNAGSIFVKSFKFDGKRGKNYDFQFGIQALVKELDNDCKLMLGIIVDHRISIRLYVINKDNTLLPIDTWEKLGKISKIPSECGFQKKTQRNDFWLKYLSDNEKEWYFGNIHDATLELLSNMAENIKNIIVDFKKTHIKAIKLIEEPMEAI